MASLYKQPKSPYWWIKCRDTKPGSPTFGKIIRFSTGMRIGVGPETRLAREREAELTVAERKSSKGSGTGTDETWETWVPGYLKVRCKSPLTLSRYTGAWRSLSLFMREKEINVPRQLTRERCLEYLTWRAKPNKSIGKYRAVHNTALLELKILRLLMSEAVRRGHTHINPARELGIERKRPKEKPELTDEHLKFIADAIEKQPTKLRMFFRNSFIIARYQGCRMMETHVNPQVDVDINKDGIAGVIRFIIKRGREHTAPLHPKLIPLFQELKKLGATETYPKPAHPSHEWFEFFDTCGIRDLAPDASFHCLRVTAITRMARAGIPENHAMQFIGHGQTTVHRIYQRLRVQDLGDCLTALNDPADTPALSKNSGSPAATSERPTEKNNADN